MGEFTTTPGYLTVMKFKWQHFVLLSWILSSIDMKLLYWTRRLLHPPIRSLLCHKDPFTSNLLSTKNLGIKVGFCAYTYNVPRMNEIFKFSNSRQNIIPCSYLIETFLQATFQGFSQIISGKLSCKHCFLSTNDKILPFLR